ncbi:MAG: hypothetical protein ACTSU2_16300 [Promethearchaeota archaeon]
MNLDVEKLKDVYEKKLKEKEKIILMGYLREYLDNLCNECVSDRMINVLNPRCRRRFIINVRILSGSTKEELPIFCYTQVLSNLKRFKNKKTTLFTPIDVIIYNEDFFELFFENIGRKIYKLVSSHSIKEAINTIEKSKIPAIYASTIYNKPGFLRNILKKDKIVKEGSFIYNISENYFIIWHENHLYVADLRRGYAFCNVQRENIESIELLKMIIPLYSEGKNFKINLEERENLKTFLQITIPNVFLINASEETFQEKFSQITEEIGKYEFPRTSFSIEEKGINVLVQFDPNITFSDLNKFFNMLSELSKEENINLLDEI